MNLLDNHDEILESDVKVRQPIFDHLGGPQRKGVGYSRGREAPQERNHQGADSKHGGWRAELEAILLAAKAMTNADGATLYRTTEDGRALRFEIVRTDSLHLAMGGVSGAVVDLPNVPLVTESGIPNDSMVAAYALIHDKTVNVADAYNAAGFDFSGTRRFDERTGYHSQSFLTVPIKSPGGEAVGVLQLINAQDPLTKSVRPFSASDQRLAELLASQAAVVLNNRSPPLGAARK